MEPPEGGILDVSKSRASRSYQTTYTEWSCRKKNHQLTGPRDRGTELDTRSIMNMHTLKYDILKIIQSYEKLILNFKPIFP